MDGGGGGGGGDEGGAACSVERVLRISDSRLRILSLQCVLVPRASSRAALSVRISALSLSCSNANARIFALPNSLSDVSVWFSIMSFCIAAWRVLTDTRSSRSAAWSCAHISETCLWVFFTKSSSAVYSPGMRRREGGSDDDDDGSDDDDDDDDEDDDDDDDTDDDEDDGVGGARRADLRGA